MAGPRISIKPAAKANPTTCVRCGQEAMYVAELLNDRDVPVGTTLVCTNCVVHRKARAES